MTSLKLRKSWLLRIGSAPSQVKIPRKFSVIKKSLFFNQSFFFPQIVFSGASVWSWEYINRASGGHTGNWISATASDSTARRWECHPTTPSDQITACRPARYSICLFILSIQFIFLATTCLHIVGSKERERGVLNILLRWEVILTFTFHILWKCLRCNNYYNRKWTLKSWTRLFAFRIVLVLLRTSCIQLSSLQLWVNSRADWVLYLGIATGLR